MAFLTKGLLALFGLCLLLIGGLILILLGGRHVRTLNRLGRNRVERPDAWGLNLKPGASARPPRDEAESEEES